MATYCPLGVNASLLYCPQLKILGVQITLLFGLKELPIEFMNWNQDEELILKKWFLFRPLRLSMHKSKNLPPNIYIYMHLNV